MRGRWLLTNCGLLIGAAAALAQPPIPPRPPQSPPRSLPPGLAPGGSAPAAPLALPQDAPLPQPENKFPIKATDVTVKRIAGGSWQVWCGQTMLRDFGTNETNAHDAARVYRDLHPTEWATIGRPRPVVEYGLVNGRPPVAPGLPTGSDASGNTVQAGVGSGPLVSGAGAKAIIPIDLRTVRVEAVRGVWCVRDDATLHFNFGANKADAEQAVAVIRRYGFNRVGVVGTPAVMHYLFAGASDMPHPSAGPFAKAALQAQIDGLTRVGIPVGGVGFVGEMVRFDPRRLDARKENGEWVVGTDAEVIGRFGPSEFAARDALRTIRDARFNEFCTLGSAGTTFFLVDGRAPTRVPFHVQGRRFDPSGLKVSQAGGKWAVTENGRHLLDCATAEEGETLVRVLKHYQFDQLCHMGPSARVGLSFFAKGR
jgi:hypothetical protein